MKTYYNIEVQMLGECERTFDLDREIGETLGFTEDNIDEREIYRMTAMFSTEIIPQAMRYRVIELFEKIPSILYVDVLHWSESEQIPQRFVAWSDGKIQKYKTRIIYEEVD